MSRSSCSPARTRALICVVVLVALVAVGAGTVGTGAVRAVGALGATTASASAPAGGSGRPARVTLEPVADIEGTTALARRAGDPDLYVTTQRGLVVALSPDGRERRTVLDLTSFTLASGERGLLGLAFAPDGEHVYVHYSGRTSGETVVEEYAVGGGGIDPTSRRVVLTVPQPQPNHNGGQLAFGPDGYLYIGLGDGGGRDDEGRGHAPEGNGQHLDTLLGKILRIDPRPSGGMPYTIPDENPFADGEGRREIFVSGLRNPWRFSFDRKTGDLWVADVGEDAYEEVTRLPLGEAAGANLGWNVFEGTERFRDGPPDDAFVMPVIQTSHDDGNCSITGGFVYRGEEIDGLRGWYLFTDYCNGEIIAARVTRAGTVKTRGLGVELPAVSSFGEDTDGELYVLSQRDGVFRIVPG